MNDEYAKRRSSLMKAFADSDSLIYLKGHGETPRNDPSNDLMFPFRQNSTFQYFTGVDRLNFSAILIPKEGKYILFGPEMGPDQQVWMGTQPSHEELKELYGADEIHIPDKMKKIVDSYDPKVIHALPLTESPFKGKKSKTEFGELGQVVFDMRMYKSKEEIKEMERAHAITKRVHEAMMALTRPGLKECQLKAIADFAYAYNDATYAYPPIVTVKGEILHNSYYGNNLEDGQLLLVDAGAEVKGYASDITRTWPVNGKFSPEQKDVYEIVLKAQLESIKMVKPGATLRDAYNQSARIIAEGLKEIGILKGGVDSIIEKDAYSLFYMHGLGHGLGLDVHDAHGFFELNKLLKINLDRPLKQGRITTVEPGIYFNEVLLNNQDKVETFEEWVDFDKARSFIHPVSGIRIEDNVLVTEKRHRALGEPIPKKPEELEQIVGSQTEFVMSNI